jgi:opacity protein-like surface antigen
VKKLAAVMFLVPLMASPAKAEGLYGSLQGGATFLNDARNDGNGIDIESRNDTGWAISGSLGYALPYSFRVEGEVGYRRNSIDRLDVRSDGGLGRFFGVPSLNGASLPTEGHEVSITGLANVWYDIKTGTIVTPYLGGGIGLGYVEVEDLKTSGFTLVDDSDIVFAYQLGAGVAVAVAPNVSLTLDYRFLATTAPTFKDFEGVSFDSEYNTHNILAGVRIAF